MQSHPIALLFVLFFALLAETQRERERERERMAQIPNLDNAPINLTSIREKSQKELITILKNIRGKKCVVIDPKLGGSLSLIEHGVELRHLTADPVLTECTKVVYLVRAQLDLMKFICSHVHNDASKGLQREYFVYFVPRHIGGGKSSSLDDLSESTHYMNAQLTGDMSSLWHIAKAIHKLEFSFGLIPNVRAKGKASVRVADILNRMQAEEPVNSSDMGVPEINTLILLDREVDMVTPMCSQLTYEGLLDEGASRFFRKPFLIGFMQFLRVNNGAVELDSSIMGAQQEGKKIKVPLNSSDKLFKEIRDLNFEVVVQVLRQKATSMKQDYTEMTTTSQTVSELKDFVKKLNSLPEMTRHINLAQHLSTFTSKPSFLGRLDMEHTMVEAQSYDICFEYIEEMIHKQEPLVNVLRLLILRELLHSYGFEHMATLNNLEKAGLFRKQESKSNWLTIKRALQLVVEDTDTAKYIYNIYFNLMLIFTYQKKKKLAFVYKHSKIYFFWYQNEVRSKNTLEETPRGILICYFIFLSFFSLPLTAVFLLTCGLVCFCDSPNDISYVFSGYAPLSIRLVQHAVRSGWRPVEEILKLLPGPHSESKRSGFASNSSLNHLPGAVPNMDKVGDGRRSLVLVVFIGGVTCAEISALRFLSAQEGMAYDLIVGTTKIVTGHTLTETFIENLG
ncbi:hypothetical protein HYC85_013874 [Camellia sinensis]|uniref:Uncharacterized protein n=1 Tax=Camellia sinensis TaxID=4442 RepID=A0A7J7H5S4_CAMSI|nr:hypothetical protein HYC85_013874 [Camellia sinensis]